MTDGVHTDQESRGSVVTELLQDARERRNVGQRLDEREERLGTDRLVDLVRHGPVLEALLDEPMDRGEVEEALDVSRATSHRLVRWLEDEELAVREDGRYYLTGRGEVIAEELLRFERNAGAAARLAPLLDAVCEDHKEFLVEPFADATVTVASPDDPYAPTDRFVALLRETTTFQGFNATSMLPLSLPAFADRLDEAVETELVALPAEIERLFEVHSERVRTALERGVFALRTRDAFPYCLALFDDRVGIGGYDEATGTPRAFVDTDAAIAREWAERTYRTFRDDATPVGSRDLD